MDIYKMIAELRAAHQQVEEAIVSLERLLLAPGKRRGRPPSFMTTKTNSTYNSEKRVHPRARKKKAKAEAA